MDPMHPMSSFHGSPTLSILAFAATAAYLSAAGVAILILLSRRCRFAAKRVAMVAMGMAGAYLAAMAGVSLASDERTVEPGAAKYLCGIDCTLAYSVVGSRRAAAIGDAKPSRGAWEIVTLRVWFDPASAGDRSLTPGPRAVHLVDAEGRRFDPSVDGARALEAAEGTKTSLERALRPGESYTTTLVFDVPADVPGPVLQLFESSLAARLLIGHEGSPLHARTVFRLREDPSAGGES